ncbi:MAG: hypothetical protein ACP5SH_20525 [Syntrophobacteraceae bacterium]
MSVIEEEFLKRMETLIRKSQSEGTIWEGTMKDYLGLVVETPVVAQTAPARIYEMIAERGTTQCKDTEKLRK